MNIEQFSVNSELVEIKLNSEEIKSRYGDEIIFFTKTHPKLTTYFNFFEARVNGDYERLEDIMRNLILNQQGEPAIKPDQTLPADIFTAAIIEIGDLLGKSISRTSNSTA